MSYEIWLDYPSRTHELTVGFFGLPQVLLIFLVFCVVFFVLFVYVLCLMPNVVCISGLSFHDFATSVFSRGYLLCPFVLFLLAIVLSVLLRYTDSDCPFGIFKLFLHWYLKMSLSKEGYVYNIRLIMWVTNIYYDYKQTHLSLYFVTLTTDDNPSLFTKGVILIRNTWINSSKIYLVAKNDKNLKK